MVVDVDAVAVAVAVAGKRSRENAEVISSQKVSATVASAARQS